MLYAEPDERPEDIACRWRDCLQDRAWCGPRMSHRGRIVWTGLRASPANARRCGRAGSGSRDPRRFAYARRQGHPPAERAWLPNSIGNGYSLPDRYGLIRKFSLRTESRPSLVRPNVLIYAWPVWLVPHVRWRRIRPPAPARWLLAVHWGHSVWSCPKHCQSLLWCRGRRLL